MSYKLTTLPVAALETCDRVRVRKVKPKENSEIVQEYAEAYACGLIVEPLDVFCEGGTERYIVADGEHRLLALRRNGVESIEVRLHEGDEVAALDFAIGCNQAHGLRRTKQDKYHAFVRIMETPSLRDKYRTDTELSEKIGVSLRTIARFKADWRNSEGGDARTREKKERAKEKAAKHTSPTKANLPNGRFQDADKPKEISQSTRNDRPKKQVTEEQKRVAAQVREALKREAQPKASSEPQTARASTAVVMDFQRGLACFASIPRGADLRRALNGKINWQQVEHAHAVLTELLAER